MDDTTLDIEVVEATHSGLRSLERLERTPDTAWYIDRRRTSLAAAGLTAAWNPNLHPRGRDGKFIEKWGFVRWLEDGQWRRGQVVDIDASSGKISVKRQTNGETLTWGAKQAQGSLYSLPKPKATLKLPDPKKDIPAPGFTKIGGQGGSNPGGLYKVTDAVAVNGKVHYNAKQAIIAARQLAHEPGGSAFLPKVVEIDEKKPSVSLTATLSDGFVLNMSTGRIAMLENGKLIGLGTADPVDHDEIFGKPGTDARSKASIRHIEAVGENRTKLILTIAQQSDGKPRLETEFYVKTAKSKDHAATEKLANDLYELAGVAVPDVSVGEDGVTVASKIVKGDEKQSLKSILSFDAELSVIRKDLVIDAWLANWDVVGLVHDNIIVVDGQPWRVDAGGALTYRAQGGMKGQHFGDTVGELETLRNASMNPAAAKVFGKVTDAELKDGGERLAAITPQAIRDAVEQSGVENWEGLANKLVARRADLLHKLGIEDKTALMTLPPPDPEEPIVVESPIESIDLANSYFHPILKKFTPGKTSMNDWLQHETFLSELKYAKVVDSADDAKFGDVYMRHDRNIWRAEYELLPDGSYNINLTHAVTGEKKTVSAIGSETYQVATPMEVEKYKASLFWQARAYRIEVQAQRPLKDLVDDALKWSGTPDLRVTGANLDTGMPLNGSWLISATSNDLFKVIDESPTSVTLKAVMPDGTLGSAQFVYEKEKLTWFRRQQAGSIVDDVMSAVVARAEIQKAQDAASMSPKTDAMSADDKAIQLLNVPPTPTEPDPQPLAENSTKIQIGTSKITTVNSRLMPLSDEMITVSELTNEEAEALIGRSFIARSNNVNSPASLVKIVGVSKNVEGKVYSLHAKLSNGADFWGLHNQATLIEVAPPPAVTLLQRRKDGKLVANGVVVGTWNKEPYWSKWNYDIDANYSVSGKNHVGSYHGINDFRNGVLGQILAPEAKGAKPKSAKTIELEKKVRADVEFGQDLQTADDGTAMTLLDGAKVKMDMWVISKTDGTVGQVKVIEKGTGYVKVKMADGSLKGRAASTLSAAEDPTTGEIPPASPLYKGVKLSDGSQPFPSQRITGGGKEATIIQIKPDGSMRVDDGEKKYWTSAGLFSPVKQMIEVDDIDEPGGIASDATESWKVAPKPTKIPYAAPGGVTIPQSNEAVAIYREFANARALTRDNFVPHIGMKMCDSKGNKFTVVRIADTTSGNPSTIWLRDAFGEVKGRQPGRYWVDHAAELADESGNPWPTVSGLNFSGTGMSVSLPTGSVIYKVPSTATLEGSYRSIKLEAYLVSQPDGKMYTVRADGLGTAVDKSVVAGYISGGLKKVAIVDETAGSSITFDGQPGVYSAPLHIGNAWIHKNDMGALEELKHQAAEEKVSQGVVEDEKFDLGPLHLPAFGKPTTAGVSQSVSTAPPPPAAKGNADALKGAPVVAGSHTVETAMQRLLEKRDSKEPNSRVAYAMGDADTIEDMAIRLQLAADGDGNEWVEVRFGLLEQKVDDLSDRLITNTSSKKGAWVRKSTLAPSELKAGDVLSLRISSQNVLKPASGGTPNATVVSKELVGKSKNGLDSYRVTVSTGSGAVAHVLIEQRSTPSIDVYEWDPDKVQLSASFSGSVAPDAHSMGWKVLRDGIVGYDTVKAAGKIQFDDKGRRLVDPTGTDSSYASVSGKSGAYRMRYDHADSGFMTVQITHTSAEERYTNKSDVRSKNASRRSSVNGEVVIRVKADDPAALQKISDMMAAAGVEASKQGQPSGEQLATMAANKVYKQFSKSYGHLKTPDDMGAALKSLDDIVEPALGRKTTLKDIRLAPHDDGRMVIVLSDEVADALAKTVKFSGSFHAWSAGFKPEAFTSTASTGVLSTDERWSQGILVSGASSSTDVTNDSGNRVYSRLFSGGPASSLQSGRVYMSARQILKNVDWYWRPDDSFGTRGQENLSWITATGGGGNEIMFKRKMDPRNIGLVTFGSKTVRDEAIKKLKDAGVDTIGGRPIESVFVDASDATVKDLNDIVVTMPNEIALDALVEAGSIVTGATIV